MKQLVALAEKTFWTFVQVFTVTLLAGPSIDVSTAEAAAIATIPAVASAMLAALPLYNGLIYSVDVAFRIVRTFAAGFLGYIAAIPAFELDYSVGHAAAMAGLTAVLAFLKTMSAGLVGDQTSAALLPARYDRAA